MLQLAGIILGVIFSLNIEKVRIFLSTVFNLEIFPPDIYFLEKLPSEINLFSIFIILFSHYLFQQLHLILPAMTYFKNENF